MKAAEDVGKPVNSLQRLFIWQLSRIGRLPFGRHKGRQSVWNFQAFCLFLCTRHSDECI